MEMLAISKELQGNAYPGRGIIIGKTPDGTQEVPKDYKEISFVCVRKDGMYLGRMHFPTCVAR